MARRKATAEPEVPLPKVDRATGRLVEPYSIKDYRVNPPSAKDIAEGRGYHHIFFYDEHGRRQKRSGGPTWNTANAKLAELEKERSGEAPKAGKTVSDLMDFYLNPKRVRGQRRKPWSDSTHANAARHLRHYAEPYIGTIACKDLKSKDLIDVLTRKHPTKTPKGESVIKPLTADTRRRVEGELRRLVKDGYENGFIDRRPEELLRGLRGADEVDEGYEDEVRTQGVSIKSVDLENDIPSHQQVADFAEAAKTGANTPWWYELMVYVSAYSGLRLGELLWLERQYVHTKPKRKIGVHWQAIQPKGGGIIRRGLPKGNKRRTTLFPEFTPPTKQYPDGYPLAEKLRERLGEIRGDETLLFTSPEGKPFHRNNFYNRLAVPAAKEAGWPLDDDDKLVWPWHTLRHVFCTYYLFERDAFGWNDVRDMAGHSKVSVTLDLYGSRSATDRLEQLEG